MLVQERLQKEAFETLLREKDVKHQRIRTQITLIEDELAKLSQLEIEQRDLKVNTNMVRTLPSLIPSNFGSYCVFIFLEYNQRETTSFANDVFSAHRREGQAGEGAQAQTGESFLDLHTDQG